MTNAQRGGRYGGSLLRRACLTDNPKLGDDMRRPICFILVLIVCCLALAAPKVTNIVISFDDGSQQRVEVAPTQVSPPTPFDPRLEVPVRDRWRIIKGLGLLPYDLRDPYNPNPLKGDLPVLQKQLGDEWFFNLAAISDSVVELRDLPTPVGIQSSRRAGQTGTFGRSRQTARASALSAISSVMLGAWALRRRAA